MLYVNISLAYASITLYMPWLLNFWVHSLVYLSNVLKTDSNYDFLIVLTVHK